MEIGKLTVNYRDTTGKGAARKLRAKGLVPGICYGPTLEKPLPITLDPKALKASLDPVKRRNTVIEVNVQHGDKSDATVPMMLKEYQIDPIHRDVTHVDLVAVEANKMIEVEIPIELVGKAKGIIEGGQVNAVRHSVHVSCKPADIPAKFVLDITPLDLNSILRVGDLDYPEGVTPVEDRLSPIVSCHATAEEEVKVEAADATADAAAADAGGDKAADKDKGDKKK